MRNKRKEWEKTLKLASKAESVLTNYRSNLVEMAQKHFEYELSCEYMPGDGFVFCWECFDDNCAPHVIPVARFFILAENIGEITKETFKSNSI